MNCACWHLPRRFLSPLTLLARLCGTVRATKSPAWETVCRPSLQNHCKQEELKEIVRTRLKVDKNTDYETKLYPFQCGVRDASEARVVLEAACGGGKTIAAYEWARKHIEAGRKLIICYPTTGTAAAGFEDYLLTQGDLEHKLMTSRAGVDIRRMLANKADKPEATDDEGRRLRHPNRDEDLENLMKQESLQAWGQQAIAATADFVLGLVQNHRRGLFSFPAIVKSAIVFDEIHSYDAKMFGSLVRFLRAFPNVPALLMTASLQPSRTEALKLAGVDYELISGDDKKEKTDGITWSGARTTRNSLMRRRTKSNLLSRTNTGQPSRMRSTTAARCCGCATPLPMPSAFTRRRKSWAAA